MVDPEVSCSVLVGFRRVSKVIRKGFEVLRLVFLLKQRG